MNVYLYVKNNPINRIDPLGLRNRDAATEALGNLLFELLRSLFTGEPLRVENLVRDAPRAKNGGKKGAGRGAPKTDPAKPAAEKPAAEKPATTAATDGKPSAGNPPESGGVDLSLKYKKEWTPEQKAAADQKAAALTAADTKVTHNTERKGTEQARYRKAQELDKTQDADHTVDLQLGGKDTKENMSTLDTSVNRSLGSQIDKQIKNLPEGTKVNNVRMVEPE